MNALNICMFSRILPAHAIGGMQDHVRALSAGLAARGHRVVVITTARPDLRAGTAGADFERVDGAVVYYLRGAPSGRNTWAYWNRAADKLRELHAAQPFDVLHSQSVGALGVVYKGLHRQLGLPLVTTLHGTHLDVLTTSWHSDFLLTNPLGAARFAALSLNLLYRYFRDLPLFRDSDVMIATSDADIAKYRRLYRIAPEKIRTVYNGIDTALFAPAPADSALRRELNLASDSKILLALARLQKDKGVQNALAILPRVLEHLRAVLVVVGDGDYRAALEEQARALGVAEQVRFVGAQSLETCARYFNLCDVFLNPTLRTDGYDLTIAEAMACAKPVIVSDVGANSTLVDAETGILIPRGDNAALLRETLRVLADPAPFRAISARAAEKIRARFSVRAMVAGMERVYGESKIQNSKF